MTLSVGVLLRIVSLVGAVIIAVLAPVPVALWLGLDLAVGMLGTLIP